MIIDTHCHLDNKQYFDDFEEVLQSAKNAGVGCFLIPGADLDDLPRAIELSNQNDEIFFAVGVHPYDIDSFSFEPFEKHHADIKCVAIGECGLDFFRLSEDENEKNENIAKQKDVFIKQIEFAKKVQKPLIIHIRDSSTASKKILIEQNSKEVGGVLHCFNGDEELLQLAEHNFYFGIGGVSTFKNAKNLVQSIAKIPLDKIIIETDAPYLTPHPYRGKRNEPKYTTLVVDKLCEIFGKTKEEIEHITTQNAKQLFKFNSI